MNPTGAIISKGTSFTPQKFAKAIEIKRGYFAQYWSTGNSKFGTAGLNLYPTKKAPAESNETRRLTRRRRRSLFLRTLFMQEYSMMIMTGVMIPMNTPNPVKMSRKFTNSMDI